MLHTTSSIRRRYLGESVSYLLVTILRITSHATNKIGGSRTTTVTGTTNATIEGGRQGTSIQTKKTITEEDIENPDIIMKERGGGTSIGETGEMMKENIEEMIEIPIQEDLSQKMIIKNDLLLCFCVHDKEMLPCVLVELFKFKKMTAEIGNYKFCDSIIRKRPLYHEGDGDTSEISKQDFDALISDFLASYESKDANGMDCILFRLSEFASKIKYSNSFKYANIFEKVASLFCENTPKYLSKTIALSLRKFYRYYDDVELLEKCSVMIMEYLVSNLFKFELDEICMYMALVQVMCLRSVMIKDIVLKYFPIESINNLIHNIVNFNENGKNVQAVKEILNLISNILSYKMENYNVVLEIIKNLVDELGNIWLEQICNIFYELVLSEDDNVISYLLKMNDYYEMIFESKNNIAKRNIISTLLKIFYITKICCIKYKTLIYLTKCKDDYVATQAMILVAELVNYDNSLYKEFTNYELLHILKANIQFGSFEVKKQAGFCLAFLIKFATNTDFHQFVFINLFGPTIGLFQIENDELNKQILSLILRLTNYVVAINDIQEKQLFLNNINDVDGYNIISELVEQDNDYSEIGTSILIDLEEISDSILNFQNEIFELVEKY